MVILIVISFFETAQATLRRSVAYFGTRDQLVQVNYNDDSYPTSIQYYDRINHIKVDGTLHQRSVKGRKRRSFAVSPEVPYGNQIKSISINFQKGEPVGMTDILLQKTVFILFSQVFDSQIDESQIDFNTYSSFFTAKNLDLTVIRYGSFGELIVDSIKLPQLRETVALKRLKTPWLDDHVQIRLQELMNKIAGNFYINKGNEAFANVNSFRFIDANTLEINKGEALFSNLKLEFIAEDHDLKRFAYNPIKVILSSGEIWGYVTFDYYANIRLEKELFRNDNWSGFDFKPFSREPLFFEGPMDRDGCYVNEKSTMVCE